MTSCGTVVSIKVGKCLINVCECTNYYAAVYPTEDAATVNENQATEGHVGGSCLQSAADCQGK